MVFKKGKAAEVEAEAKIVVIRDLAPGRIPRGGEEREVAQDLTALNPTAIQEVAVIPLHNDTKETLLTLAGKKQRNMMIYENTNIIPTNAGDHTAGASVKVCQDPEADPESVWIFLGSTRKVEVTIENEGMIHLDLMKDPQNITTVTLVILDTDGDGLGLHLCCWHCLVLLQDLYIISKLLEI